MYYSNFIRYSRLTNHLLVDNCQSLLFPLVPFMQEFMSHQFKEAQAIKIQIFFYSNFSNYHYLFLENHWYYQF